MRRGVCTGASRSSKLEGELWERLDMPDQENQKQVNVRMDVETVARLDECRIRRRTPQGNLPTRSDIVREAVEEFLERETGYKPER